MAMSGDLARRRAAFRRRLDLMAAMQRAGVPVLAGTDALNPFVFPGFSLHDELAFLVEGGLTPLGTGSEPRLDVTSVPSVDEIVARYAERSGRDLSAVDWYHVFARWKLGIVLEGSFAKWQKGLSDNPVHEYFGAQTDKALASALDIISE